jgi:hypothetical protein
MSDHDVKQVSALTGTFAVLKPTVDKSQAGTVEPEAGKKLPEYAKTYVSDMAEVVLRLYDGQV